MEAIIRTCQGDPPSFDTYAPSTRSPSWYFRNWVKLVLKKNPESRPTIESLIHHHFLNTMSEEEGRTRLKQFVASIPDLDVMQPAPNVTVDANAKKDSVEMTAVRWRFE